MSESKCRESGKKVISADGKRRLYMVSTPVGNLEDISLRALRLLRSATVIAAEDTRVVRRLLQALHIESLGNIISLRAHNEQAAAVRLINALGDGDHAVYVCDAGTPGISDPGGRLAQAARAAGVIVTPAPGASALTALLAVVGTSLAPEHGVHFFGFSPRPAKKRVAFFQSLRALSGGAVLFESPRRITATLAELADILGGRQRAVIGRELTKFHEQIVEGDLNSLQQDFTAGNILPRGEFVLWVETPGLAAAQVEAEKMFAALSAYLPPRRAAALTAALTGADSAALYRRHIDSVSNGQ